MKSKRLFLITGFVMTLGFLFTITISGRAQQNISFSRLQIDLWPEYDRPSMLVIYRAEISPSVSLPVTLNIRIPAAVGEPNAVAETPPNSGPLNVEFTRTVEGEWSIIQLTATQREVQIEYYDPSIETDGIKRTYVYQWPGDYDVDRVIMLVQQPIGAENMQILPRLNNITQNPENGIVYYSDDIGSFKSWETFERAVQYEKDSNSLTVEFLEIESPPVDEATPGRVSLVNIIPWGIGSLGVIIIAAGLYWYWATGRGQATPQRAGRKASRKKPRALEESEQPLSQDIYCHQCGKRAAPGDKFCRACGTRLRT
jgi:hypothetical protein